MKCPFLQETEVCSCQMASVRKQIPRISQLAEMGRCSSPRYVECPLYLERHMDSVAKDSARCEFLETSLVQFCGAAPLPRYVPYSESPAARCVTDAYRYCDEYLSLAHAGHEPGDRSIENIDMPGRLYYSRNHMWLDRADDGGCHIGIDAFLAKTLRQTDAIAFVTASGTHNPTAVLTAHGVDFQVVFPADAHHRTAERLSAFRSGANHIGSIPLRLVIRSSRAARPARGKGFALRRGGQRVDAS